MDADLRFPTFLSVKEVRGPGWYLARWVDDDELEIVRVNEHQGWVECKGLEKPISPKNFVFLAKIIMPAVTP